MSQYSHLEDRIEELERLVKYDELEVVSVKQAAEMCGIEGVPAEGKYKSDDPIVIAAQIEKSLNKKVYHLLKHNLDIKWNKPTPRMITINKMSLLKFLNKNPQYKSLRKAA